MIKNNIIILKNAEVLPKEYTQQNWKEPSKFNCKNRVIKLKNGREVKIINKKTHHFSISSRILSITVGTFISLLTVGIAPLVSKRVRMLFKSSISVRFAIPTSQPTRPLQQQPTRPLQQQPARLARPVQQQPARPAQQQPARLARLARPVQQQPTRPLQQQPARPAQQQPARPAQQQPARPLQQQPARPAQQQPARPAQQQPARPAQQQPARPAQQQPARPAQQQPARPAQQQPARPAQQQPARPAQQQPARPAQQQPARPAQQQPAQTFSQKNPTILRAGLSTPLIPPRDIKSINSDVKACAVNLYNLLMPQGDLSKSLIIFNNTTYGAPTIFNDLNNLQQEVNQLSDNTEKNKLNSTIDFLKNHILLFSNQNAWKTDVLNACKINLQKIYSAR